MTKSVLLTPLATKVVHLTLESYDWTMDDPDSLSQNSQESGFCIIDKEIEPTLNISGEICSGIMWTAVCSLEILELVEIR